jgi:hypothetical protein
MSESTPKLIEPNTKGYLYQTLQNCHQNRVSVYYYALNTSVFVIFVGITGALLYYCNKYKLSPYEKQQKMIRDQHYILSKIRYYKDETQKINDATVSSITQLPSMIPEF